MLFAGSASIAFVLLTPNSAGAFWPFSITRAAETQNEAVIHDASLNLLEAATNPDPSPATGGGDITTTGGSALIASVGPEGTVTEYTPSHSSGRISLYQVREGDALSKVASMYGVSMNTILWANDLTSANQIRPGMTLLILPVSGLQHKVAKGETLASLAKKYDADADEIAAFNGMDVDTALAAGSEVIIPGGEVAAPKAPAKKTVAKSSTTAKKPAAAASRALPAISGFFGNPLPGGRISQGVHGYNGIDMSAPSGTPIYAAAGGTVIVAKGGGGWNGGYGNYVVIDHGNGTQTLYAHMSSLGTSGGSVSKGDLIGYVGNTGKSTGNHLHFEVRGAKNPFAN